VDPKASSAPHAEERFFPRYAYFSSVCRKLGNTVKDALFPGVCFACGRLFPIAHRRYTIDGYDEDGQCHFEALFEGYLCTACRSQYAEITTPMCLHCGLPFESSHGIDHLCGDCVTQPPSYAEARAAGIYQGALKSTIHQLKYKGREHLARPLGRLLWATLRKYWAADQFDSVVPVPLHPYRLRKRGFNQAQALLVEWPRLAMRDGLRQPAEWIAPRLLVRYRPTEPQTGLKRDRRMENLRRAFRVTDRQRIRSHSVLVVDDVLTTGATADACVRTLLNAGARSVRVLTLARALL